MDFEEKLELFKQDMLHRRVPLYQAMPLPLRWLWRHHIHVPPPFFWPGLLACLGVALCLFMPMWIAITVLVRIFYGDIFSGFMLFKMAALWSVILGWAVSNGWALYRMKHGLPSWSAYGLPWEEAKPDDMHWDDVHFKEKLELFKQDMLRRHIPLHQAMPHAFRWLWRHRFYVPPPVFLHSLLIWLVLSVGFFVPMFISMSATVWVLGSQMYFLILLKLTALAGLAFGSGMTLFFSYRRSKLKLPSWSHYGSSGPHASE